MFTRSGLITAVWLALFITAGVAFAEGPNLGKPLDAAAIAAWDISIEPDGTGLPPGGGTPAQGARIYADKCAQCHGPDGKGGVTGVFSAPLVGGDRITDIAASVKRIANFWPYATTLFDYIRRSMPWQQPMTLANDEVYALTAYILALNKLIAM
jgi:S-disulfanyl-L-cysteine oxidoreductase SoxD